MREPRLRSSPSFFHPSTNRRMYRFASNGEMGEPCGMPRRLSRASVVRVSLPRLSVSSTVTVKALPGPSLEVVKTEFFFHLLVSLLADPTRLDGGGQGAQVGLRRQVGEIIS